MWKNSSLGVSLQKSAIVYKGVPEGGGGGGGGWIIKGKKSMEKEIEVENEKIILEKKNIKEKIGNA